MTLVADKSPTSNESNDIKDAVIRLAGNSQDGIQTVGGFLARSAGRSAQDVMTYMTIPSTISGGASIFQVRIGSGEVLSQEMRQIFLWLFTKKVMRTISVLLEKEVFAFTMSDHVEPDTSDKRFTFVGVPMTSTTVEAIGGSARDRGKNIFCFRVTNKSF